MDPEEAYLVKEAMAVARREHGAWRFKLWARVRLLGYSYREASEQCGIVPDYVRLIVTDIDFALRCAYWEPTTRTRHERLRARGSGARGCPMVTGPRWAD